VKVTSAPLSLISYHLLETEKIIPTVYRVEKEEELMSVLRLGTMFDPAFSLIEYKGKPPSNLELSIFNTVYLCTEKVETWQQLNKSWVEILEIYPELYKKKVSSAVKYLEEEAFDYLWNTYKNHPKKLIGEVFKIALSSPKRKQTIEDLGVANQKDINLFLDICDNLGNLSYCKTIFELPESSLRQLLIGSEKKPPYMYYFLVGHKRKIGSNPELWQAVEILREAVESKLMSINTGAVLFNQWVSQLTKVRLNYKKYEFQFNCSHLIQLENLLKGN